MTLSITHTQHNNTPNEAECRCAECHNAKCRYAECCYAECRGAL